MKSPSNFSLDLNNLSKINESKSDNFPVSRDRCKIHNLTFLNKKKYIQTCGLFQIPCICYSMRENEDFKYKLKQILPRLDHIIYKKRKLLELQSNQF